MVSGPAKLDVIGETVAGEEGMVDPLDVVQAPLDAQTGVLGEQLTVLARIRDGLDG